LTRVKILSISVLILSLFASNNSNSVSLQDSDINVYIRIKTIEWTVQKFITDLYEDHKYELLVRVSIEEWNNNSENVFLEFLTTCTQYYIRLSSSLFNSSTNGGFCGQAFTNRTIAPGIHTSEYQYRLKLPFDEMEKLQLPIGVYDFKLGGFGRTSEEVLVYSYRIIILEDKYIVISNNLLPNYSASAQEHPLAPKSWLINGTYTSLLFNLEKDTGKIVTYFIDIRFEEKKLRIKLLKIIYLSVLR
jgi:hypothetical protein